MRTTLEMSPEHRRSLLDVAAKRGEKGFSGVVAEALEAYLSAEKGREKLRNDFISLAGSLDPQEADELRAKTQALRNSWR